MKTKIQYGMKAAVPAPAPAAPPPPTPPPPPTEVTLEEIKTLIATSVTEAVTAGLDEKFKGQVTLDGVKSIVDEALKVRGTEKAMTAADIKALSEEATKKATESIRRDKKPVLDPDDAGVLTFPVSWCKGNLPLHAKQLLNCLMKKDMNDGVDASMIANGQRLGDAMFARARVAGAKALTVGGSTTGVEWMPTDLSSELLRRLYLESQLAQLMLGREIEMPTNPYKLPISTTRPIFYGKTTEGTAVAESTPGTDDVTLTAKTLQALISYSYEIDEDAIIPILPTIQNLLAEAAAYAMESSIINGDSDGTHQDSDTNSVTNAAEEQFEGLRHIALAQANCKIDLASGGLSRANLLATLKKLGKYGKNVKDLAWLVGAKGQTDIMSLDDVVTVDKAGPRATMVTGTIASYFGIPIIVSEACREDLNTSGVYQTQDDGKGGILVVNLSRFLLGNRRGFMVETFRDIKAQENFISASFRKAFMPIEVASSSITPVVYGYGYTA